MLNRRTRIEDPDAPEIDIQGHTTWRCRYGHVTQVWLRFNGRSAYGGSAWDFCDRCNTHPNAIQDTKAHLEIFSKWLDDELITLTQYRGLTHAIVSTMFSPIIEADPIAFLGLPTWQQVQNDNIKTTA